MGIRSEGVGLMILEGGVDMIGVVVDRVNGQPPKGGHVTHGGRLGLRHRPRPPRQVDVVRGGGSSVEPGVGDVSVVVDGTYGKV